MERHSQAGNNLQVLVVDDDDAMRYGLARELKNCGCCVNESDSVESALTDLKTSHYDIVFCDLRFPGGKDGDEFLETATADYPETAIVIVSCSMDSSQKAELLSQGAALCLQKPVFMHHCLNALEQLKVKTA